MSHFDPENYTISIRKENIEGETLYVARIAELPDVIEFADSYNDARALAIDTLETSFQLFQEQGIAFPEPSQIELFTTTTASGRITLRIPRTLHLKLIQHAEMEGTSLNQYIVSALSMSYTCNDIKNSFIREFNRSVVSEIKDAINSIRSDITKYQTAATTYLFKEYISKFETKSTSSWNISKVVGQQ